MISAALSCPSHLLPGRVSVPSVLPFRCEPPVRPTSMPRSLVPPVTMTCLLLLVTSGTPCGQPFALAAPRI